MKYRFAIAVFLNLLVVVGELLMGIYYLLASEITPYHKQVIDVDWNDLTLRCQDLILTLMKGTGLAGIVIAVSIGILLAVPFGRRENWSRWAILAIGSVSLVPMLIGSLRLYLRGGATFPCWANATLLVFIITAFLLTKDFKGT